MWIRRPHRFRDSGKTVNVYLDTVDTGERREEFGHTARHLITRERRIAQAGACSGNSGVDKDGWYISQPTVSYEASLQAIDAHPCRDRIVVHGTKIRKGFLVLETTTEKSPGQSASRGQQPKRSSSFPSSHSTRICSDDLGTSSVSTTSPEIVP